MMSRLSCAGLILGSLCSSSRLAGSQAHSWISSLHLIRAFSNSSQHASIRRGTTVPDPVTGLPRRRTPGAPLPSLQDKSDAAACRKAIEEGESPETVFASRLRTGNLSMAAAAVCLTEASQRGHIEKKLGQRALAWLWNQRGDLIYPDDNDLVYAMVNLLACEGQEEEIWRWMSCESTRSKRLPLFIQYEWRDTALKGLLMSKARLSTDRSLDDAIKAFLRSTTTPFFSEGGAASWLYNQLVRYKSIQAHETSPLVNKGRRWEYVWPNTSVELWEEAVRALPHIRKEDEVSAARIAMYHVRAPNPEPIRMLFGNAMDNPGHPLHKVQQSSTIRAFRTHAVHASDELRRDGRHEDAARLDAARAEIFPLLRQFGDRSDREGIFAQGKPARKLPFPKFK